MKKVTGFSLPHIIYCTKDARYTCFYCKLEFFCEGSLYVHLTTLIHLGLPNLKFQINPEFQCSTCGSDISLTNITKHACVEKAFRNYWESVRFIDEFGSPNMCLLCRGLMFESPAHLNVHFLINHKWKDFDNDVKNKPSPLQKPKLTGVLQCPICLSIFKTNDKLVLHRHAFDDHTPEIGITMLNNLSGFSRAKYGSVNDLKQWLVKRIYSCQFPNFRVKRYPINNSRHINRLLPGFSTTFCSETFPSLFHLSSHLITYHFIDDISQFNNNESKMSTHQQREEQERRLCVMQQEIDLRKRTLLGKGIIIDKIPASQYCLECFRLYETNFELQVHYMIFHLNMSWNICGICSYDCKQALGFSNGNFLEEGIERSYTLLWNALWNHEKCHILFFKALAENPSMTIPVNCLMDFPTELKPVLELIEGLSDGADENSKDLVPQYMFTSDQIAAFMEIGLRNIKMQTEYMINESLNEKT